MSNRAYRDPLITKAFNTIIFVAQRKWTSPTQLAQEMDLSIRQARRYLRSLELVLPLTTKSETVEGRGSPTTYYQIDYEWRKRHGFNKTI